ncbi:MAG: type II toxin-antitoxin system VapC family toxin [Thermococcus sp.]|nr:type II toxin-antitoxin system VapC family toxin [Thermococcus sp.]
MELELLRRELLKEKKRPKGDFRKLRGILGKAEFEELKAYELEAEFGDYVDANVMYSYLFETPMSESAERILGYPDKAISRTTINKAVYVTFRRLARDRGITNIYDAEVFAKSREGRLVLKRAYSLVLELVNLSGVEIIEEENDIETIIAVSEKFGLLPNGAIIVATCLKHGITEIATFDKDFEGIQFLKVIRS